MIPRAKKGVISDNDIMMYAVLAFKHLRLMVLLVCLAMCLGLLYFSFARPVFYSKALVRCQFIQRPVDADKMLENMARRLTSLLNSPILTERTARRLGVKGSATGIKLLYLPKQRISFDADRNIVIEVWTFSPAWARKWAQSLVDEFEIHRDEQRAVQMNTMFELLPKEIEEARQKWEEALDTKFDFRDTNELTKIAIDLNQYKDLPRQIFVLRRQLEIMESTRAGFTNQDIVARLSLLKGMERNVEEVELDARQAIPQISVGEVVEKEENTSSIIVLPAALEMPLKQPWEDFDKEKRQIEQSLRELGRTYLPGYPKMAALKKQLDKVNTALDLEWEVAQNRFNLDYAHRQSELQTLESKLPAYQEITRRYEKFNQEYSRFSAGHVAWQGIYLAMSKRLESADYSVDKERVQLQFLDMLEVNDTPVTPQRLKLMLYSLVLGLALAIAIPFLIEYIDSRVSDVEQVEEALRIRGLGVVPKVTEQPIDHLLTDDHTPHKMEYHMLENFRLIRTNLVMNSANPALPQVILVTSAMPQEGKTVVAANLAVSFARKGETTLLIDADLRRGRLHRLFECQNKPGLGEILAENRPLEEGLRPISNGNGNGHLSLLTCGKHLHWGSELLDSPAFTKLMDSLRQRYQRIIIDTPPVLGLSETAIIQRVADGVLLVIWSEYTPMRNVKVAIQTLQTNGAKFAGFVLNRLDFRALANRYRYFYYSPYYYSRYKPIETAAAPAVPEENK